MAALPLARFQQQDLLRIGGADTFLLLSPAHGGRLVRWVCGGRDVLYWPDGADWTNAAKIRGGNPLLFPFIGRHFVEGNAGQWRDATGVVRALPQHGFARDLPFAVTAWSDDAVTLSLASSPATRAGYPFDFVFEVAYRLLPDALEATLRITNTGSAPLPCYAGHHFYFALPHAARGACALTIPPAQRQRQRPDGSLSAAEQGDTDYRLDDARLQDTFHVLPETAPQGSVTLAMPGGRTIAIDLDMVGSVAWHAVTTWTESEHSDFYCVEPWLGLPDAIHHGQGLQWIAPGERMSASCRLRLATMEGG